MTKLPGVVNGSLLVSLGAVVLLSVLQFGCPQAAKTAIDLTDAVCEVLSQDLQNEPDVVKFACTAIEKASGDQTDAGTPAKFIARVPKAQARAFAMQYCK